MEKVNEIKILRDLYWQEYAIALRGLDLIKLRDIDAYNFFFNFFNVKRNLLDHARFLSPAQVVWDNTTESRTYIPVEYIKEFDHIIQKRI